MHQSESLVFRRLACAAALVFVFVAFGPTGPSWTAPLARAQAGCGVAAAGDGPGENGFQVDGQFYSGPAADDWAQGATPAGVLLDEGSENPAYAPAYHTRDEDWSGGGSDCSTFQGESDKNGDDIGAGGDPWFYGCGSFAQKYDLTDVYAHARVLDVGGAMQVWLVLAALTRGAQGESYLDFEWNVAGLEQVAFPRSSDGRIIGLGSHGGRTAGVDFIVTADLHPGGGTPDVTVRRWFDTGGTYEYVLFDPGPGNVYSCVDAVGAVAPPWGAIAADGSEILPPGTLTPYQLVEVAVELTSVGIDPADLVSDQSTLICKSRQSASFTAELQDFSLFPFRIIVPSAGVQSSGDTKLRLSPPAPNPSSRRVNIQFEVPDHAGPVRLRIYNVGGRLVKTLLDGSVPGGPGTVSWDGTDDQGSSASSGVYFVKLTATGGSIAEKVLLLR
jgi:hypothetical protein